MPVANAEFVGHPLVDFARTPLTVSEAREHLNLCETEDDQDAPVIGFDAGELAVPKSDIFYR